VTPQTKNYQCNSRYIKNGDFNRKIEKLNDKMLNKKYHQSKYSDNRGCIKPAFALFFLWQTISLKH